MDMIERVARAIAQSDEQNGGPPYDWRIAQGKHAKEQLFDEARAAIEAMRQPSNEMLEAMHGAMFADKFTGTELPMLGAGFEAAIDAALDPNPAPKPHPSKSTE